jgi:hypothetical protein
MRINKNTIFSEKALQKHKRVEEKKKKIDDVLHVIKDKRQEEENARIRRLNYLENRGRFAVLDDSSSDEDDYAVLKIKPHVSPRLQPVKTCNKSVSFIDKKAQELAQKKTEKYNAYMESLYGYWPLPSMKDIMKGRRSFLDYPDNALLFELTEVHGGWSIYMEFMEGKLVGGRLGVIEHAINNARRKRRWLWSPEEHARIEREDAEREEAARLLEEERCRKIEEEARLLEEERLRKIEEAARILEEERLRKIEEAARIEEERLRVIKEAKEVAEREQAALIESLRKQMQDSIYYRAFNEYLYIPGGWGYVVDVFDSNYRHPVQSSCTYFDDSDTESISEEEEAEDADTDIEDFMDCISDTE